MHHTQLTTELVRTIQEERLQQAHLRRERSKQLISKPRSEHEAMRMALGPGTQFGGVTEQVLDTVVHRSGSARAA